VDLAPLKDVFQNYSGISQDPDTKAVNALQCEVFAQKCSISMCLVKLDCNTFFLLQLRCCGVYNYTDWLETPWFNHSKKYEVPLSCCNKKFHDCNGTLDSPLLLYNEVQTLNTFELPYV